MKKFSFDYIKKDECNFIMMCGIPGCGKSTLSKELYSKFGYDIISSDSIREELFEYKFKELEDVNDIPNDIVFSEVQMRIKQDLTYGYSCVMDSTNLSMKKRMGQLSQLTKLKCNKYCILFLIPEQICLENNKNRKNNHGVNDQVIDKMLRNFTLPDLYEGFDEVFYVFHEEYIPDLHKELQSVEFLKNFSQDNHNHTYSLGDHMMAAYEYICDNCEEISERTKTDIEDLCIVAQNHDIGKVYTKDFHNLKGEETEDAHYYGHDNYGAYVYLVDSINNMLHPNLYNKNGNLILLDFDMMINKITYEAHLINWHMAPFLRWKDSISRKEKDREILSKQYPNMIEDIEIVNEADVNAH
jgi:predicted kinase